MVTQFTEEDANRTRQLFSIRNERSLSNKEEQELHDLIDRWERVYYEHISLTSCLESLSFAGPLVDIDLLRMVSTERERGIRKWGAVDREPSILLNAAIEELGEIAHAINHDEGDDIILQEVAETIGVLSRLYDMVKAKYSPKNI